MTKINKKGFKINKKIIVVASVLLSLLMLFSVNLYIHGRSGSGINVECELEFDKYPNSSLTFSEVKANCTLTAYEILTGENLGSYSIEDGICTVDYLWYSWNKAENIYEEINSELYGTTKFEDGVIYQVKPIITNYSGEAIKEITVKFNDPKLVLTYDQYNRVAFTNIELNNSLWCNSINESDELITILKIPDLGAKSSYINMDDMTITIDIDKLLAKKDNIDLNSPVVSFPYDEILILPESMNARVALASESNITNISKYFLDDLNGLTQLTSASDASQINDSKLYRLTFEIVSNGNNLFTYTDKITINEKKNNKIVSTRTVSSNKNDFYYSSNFNSLKFSKTTSFTLNYMYDDDFDNIKINFRDLPSYDIYKTITVSKNSVNPFPEYNFPLGVYEGYIQNFENIYTEKKDDNFVAYYSTEIFAMPLLSLEIVEQPTKENGYIVKTNISSTSPLQPEFTWQKVSIEEKDLNYYSTYNDSEYAYKKGQLNVPFISPKSEGFFSAPLGALNNDNEIVSTLKENREIYSLYNEIDLSFLSRNDSLIELKVVNLDGTKVDFDKVAIDYSFTGGAPSGYLVKDNENEYNVKIDCSKRTDGGNLIYDDIFVYDIKIKSDDPFKVILKPNTKIYDDRLKLLNDYYNSQLVCPSVILDILRDDIGLLKYQINRVDANNGEFVSYNEKNREFPNLEREWFNILVKKGDVFNFVAHDLDGNPIDVDHMARQLNNLNTPNDDALGIITIGTGPDYVNILDFTNIDSEEPYLGDDTYVYQFILTHDEPFTISFSSGVHYYDKYSLKRDIENNKALIEYPIVMPYINYEDNFYFGPNKIENNKEIKSIYAYDKYFIELDNILDPNTELSIDISGVDNIRDMLIRINSNYDNMNNSKILTYTDSDTITLNLANDDQNILRAEPFDDNGMYQFFMYFYYDKPFTIKFNKIKRVSSEDIPDYDEDTSNNNKLDVNNIESGTYRCKVSANVLSPVSGTPIPMSVLSNNVTYTKENTPGGGGGGSSHKKKDDEKKEEPKVEEPIQVENKNKSYMNGYEDKTFKPNSNVARQEVATILARISELFSDTSSYTSYLNKYNDVRYDDWYSNYLGFISKENILEGYTEETGTSFHPKDSMTRAEFATAVVRMFNLKDDTNKKCNLTDISGKWYEKNVSTLYNLGLINGYEDNSFRGNQGITRAEVCKIINAATKRYIKDSTTISSDDAKKLNNMFSDISSKDWFYYDVLTATVDFTYKETTK